MSDFDPRFDPAFQRGYDGPTVIPSKKTDATATETPLITITAQAAALADADALPVPRGNPFLISLGAAAVLLTAAGVALVFQLRTLFADTQANSDFDYITLQTLMIGAPILVGLGIATGIGVLFVFAVRWGRG